MKQRPSIYACVRGQTTNKQHRELRPSILCGGKAKRRLGDAVRTLHQVKLPVTPERNLLETCVANVFNKVRMIWPESFF